MQLAVSLPMGGLDVRDTVDLVRASQSWGYEAAWASEVAGPDFASLLGAVAATTDMELGVAVVPVQTRAPWLLAATAATLSHLSGGRFTLGVGTSSEVIVQQWSGIPFERPLARLRETVTVLRQLLSGERVRHHGDFLDVDGYRLFAPPPAPVAIVVGALNSRSLHQAGEIGDGVCLNQLGPEHVPGVLADVHDGARAAGRDPASLSVVARLFCWATEDVTAARDHVRRVFAPYAATRAYNRFFRSLGFQEEMEALDRAFADGDRAAAAAALSDQFVDSLYVVGDESVVAERVQAYVDAGVTVPVVACVSPDRDDTVRTLRAVARLVH